MSGGERAPPYPAAAWMPRQPRTVCPGLFTMRSSPRPAHAQGCPGTSISPAGSPLRSQLLGVPYQAPGLHLPPPSAALGCHSTLLCCLLPALPAPNLTACCLQPPPRLLTGWDGTPHTAQRHPDPHPHPRHPRRTWSSCQGWGRGSLRVGSVWGLPPAVPCCPRSLRDKRSLKYILACILASVMQGTVISLRLRILKMWRPRT